jgi:pimeloyl-ACP methyl ester carboxylesterase
LETVDGVQRSAIVNVSPANCINNRLTKLLHYLARACPEEGWSKFLKAGAPRWERIAFGGHSQGGVAAAMLAKLHLVARVVLFSTLGDVVGPMAAHWLSTHATPSDRYYGLAVAQRCMVALLSAADQQPGPAQRTSGSIRR